MGATADAGGTTRAESTQEATTTVPREERAREAQEESHQEQEEAQWAALLKEAGQAAAKLTVLMGRLAGTWQTSLTDTEARVMAQAARLVPAAECMGTTKENLAFPSGQPGSTREQMWRAKAHLSFAWLHMAAAQRLQTPAKEMGAPPKAQLIPAGAQLEKALTEA
jgi:hypothetical protein